MTIEDAGITWCDICNNLTKCRIVYACDIRGNPIRDKIYGKTFCDVCWDNVDPIKKYRIENPYNGRIRHESEGSSHPCIVCGTYIDNGLLWCPGDRKCFRRGKKIGLCIGYEYRNGPSQNTNGVHQYEKIEFDNQKYLRLVCKYCNHELTILKYEYYEGYPHVTGLDEFFYNANQGSKIFAKLHNESNPYRKTKKNPTSGPLQHECLKRDRYRCRECGATNQDTVLEIDHIIPKSQGGCDELYNLQTLCMVCNRVKHNRHWIEGNTEIR